MTADGVKLATEPTVLSVQVGSIAPLGPDGVPSGFIKRPVDGPIRVGALNLEGDKQADLRVHGGPDKDAVDINPHLLDRGGFHLVRKFLKGHVTYSLSTASNWQDS